MWNGKFFDKHKNIMQKKKKKKKNWNRREADDCVFGSFMETVLYVFYDPIAVACSNFTLHINGVENI